ncbi:efflux RND transporter periplasmic adaptor subunit [Planctomicrobium piriforme]|uniref:Multidrug efflux pump subunit AcrA (Membrane-fusion protein) n=1 Tax=Planctomicrobium piriforme TaxID=1576369 RepID=A0A1I3GKB1_9PLAN|nr:efflux RND transporter periplasmic adaptor subunit [Planctomicrobium piriforme]SFI23945.1 Multidrug efflux pump subunit AcrA (membrane-fusion protein) [Planctomicrobium piriforme]
MTPTSRQNTRSPRSRLSLLLLAAGTICSLALVPVISYGVGDSFPRIPNDGFTMVEIGHFEVCVQERGELQSSRNTVITSRCEWNANLLWIKEEGSFVNAGDIVAELDSAPLIQREKERQVLLVQAQSALQTAESGLKIQELVNESRIAAAQLQVVLTSLNLAGYRMAQATQERHVIEQNLALADAALIYARKKYEYTARMVELGYKDISEQDSERINLMRSEQTLAAEKNKLRVLSLYGHDRKLIELTAAQSESVRALERAQLASKAALLNGKIRVQAYRRVVASYENFIKRIGRSIAACTIRAKQSGQVIYPRSSSRSTQTTQPGDLVYYLQPLLQLPDRTQIEVLIRLHESRIRQLELGQPVAISVEALPDVRFTGHVASIATVPQRGRFPNQDLRDYQVLIAVDAEPAQMELLAPGMTANVNVLVGQCFDSITVPLETVVCVDGRKMAFVRSGDEIEAREVQVGLTNETEVEVLSGLKPGEEIVSRPRDTCSSRIESLRAPYDEAGTGLAAYWEAGD